MIPDRTGSSPFPPLADVHLGGTSKKHKGTVFGFCCSGFMCNSGIGEFGGGAGSDVDISRLYVGKNRPSIDKSFITVPFLNYLSSAADIRVVFRQAFAVLNLNFKPPS